WTRGSAPALFAIWPGPRSPTAAISYDDRLRIHPLAQVSRRPFAAPPVRRGGPKTLCGCLVCRDPRRGVASHGDGTRVGPRWAMNPDTPPPSGTPSPASSRQSGSPDGESLASGSRTTAATTNGRSASHENLRGNRSSVHGRASPAGAATRKHVILF